MADIKLIQYIMNKIINLCTVRTASIRLSTYHHVVFCIPAVDHFDLINIVFNIFEICYSKIYKKKQISDSILDFKQILALPYYF